MLYNLFENRDFVSVFAVALLAEGVDRNVKNGEGWRDAWNFVDTALRLIENAEYLGDLRVIKEKGITFGPVTEQDAVPDFYPYWFAWAEFSVEETLTRNPKSYQHLL